MYRSIRLLIVFILATALVSQAIAQTKTYAISGVVLDQSGRPERNVAVAREWRCENGRLTPVGETMMTDVQGRFSGSLSVFRFPISLMAVDHRNRLGDVILVHPSDLATGSLSLRLTPLKSVDMKVSVKELPGTLENDDMEIFAESAIPSAPTKDGPEMAFLLRFGNSKAPLRLPTGDYRLLVRTRTIRYFQHTFAVRAEDRRVNLGTLTAEASTEGMLFGHVLPEWHIQDARGLSPQAKLSDFRGKWVLVESWAYWCVPCVEEGIPQLMKFWDRHRDQQDRFQAIAFHTHGTWEKQKVSSISDVDRLTESTKGKFWGGRDIPVPILVDRGEETADLWGIGAIPNVMLIDPNGVLVKTQDPYGYLEHALARSR